MSVWTSGASWGSSCHGLGEGAAEAYAYGSVLEDAVGERERAERTVVGGLDMVRRTLSRTMAAMGAMAGEGARRRSIWKERRLCHPGLLPLEDSGPRCLWPRTLHTLAHIHRAS